jgi:asparagine synthase (glutamine-hydrolysing)
VRGHSDTETLLAAIEAWGVEEALRRCIGMFAFALWDRQERVLTLARDRLGEKPLYYGWQGQGRDAAFVFGSELKALRAHPSFDVWCRDALCLQLPQLHAPRFLSTGIQTSTGRCFSCSAYGRGGREVRLRVPGR